MNLYRILAVASKESRAVKVAGALENYAKAVKLPSFKLPTVVSTGGVMKIANVPVSFFETRLKLGYIGDTMEKIYKIEKLPSAIELKMINEVKDLPSYQIGKASRAAETLKDSVGTVGIGVTASDVAKNSKLTAIVDYMKGKSFWSLTAGTVVVGASTIYVLNAIEKHRNLMSGCFRYEMVNGKIEACKVQSCSCVDGVPAQGSSLFCSADKIPTSMLSTSACQGTTGRVCVNCPIQTSSTSGDLDDTESLSKPADSDKIYYDCKSATFWEAVSDLVGDKIDAVVGIGESVVTEAGSALSLLLKVAKYGLVVIGVCGTIACVIWLYFYIQKSASVTLSDKV